jgi:hypothetical protein
MLAGVKTLVMSLWMVPNLTTAILKDRFYDDLLRRGLGRAEALRDAQHHVRTLTVGTIRETWLSPDMIARLAAGSREAQQDLAQQSNDHRPFADPYYWGAFVCLGQLEPMPDPWGVITDPAPRGYARDQPRRDRHHRTRASTGTRPAGGSTRCYHPCGNGPGCARPRPRPPPASAQ